MRIGLYCLATSFLVGACNHQTLDQKLIHDVGTATSWIATLDLATGSWLGNRVPSAFMADSIDAARKTLDQAKQAVDGSRADASLRQRLGQQLGGADDAAAELNGAIHRNDRAAAMRARLRFASAYQALHAIEKQNQP